MADPNEAGTLSPKPTGSENAGTVGGGSDGSEQSGRPVDPGLLKAWELKTAAENVNKIEERAKTAEQRAADAEARLNALMAQQYAQAGQDPFTELVTELRQTSPYDVNSRGTLAALTLQATNAAELNAMQQMMKLRIPPERQDAVLGLIRQSGYRVSVEEADMRARGAEVPSLERQLEAERKKREELERVLNARTVNGSGGGNPATTTPAAMSGNDVPEMTPEEYSAALARGGPEALALRDKGVRFKR